MTQGFIEPDKEGRKQVVKMLNLDEKFIRAFDLIMVEGHLNNEGEIILNSKTRISLIEIKSTRKKPPDNPKGFFFGATENEFNIK